MREKIITQELVTECKRLRELGHDEKRIAYEMQISQSAVKRALSGKISEPFNCDICGKEFISVSGIARFCSFECRYVAQKRYQIKKSRFRQDAET